MNKDKHDKVFVTQPDLPDIDSFMVELKKIWDNKILTNNGPYHKELEESLASYLGVPYISLFSNGTIALTTAIQALNLSGEIITTPYSFVATTHSVWWNKITPVFVDVDPLTGNMDPSKLESAITEYTSAILPVHVYGIPCNHERIQAVANKYNLKLIYDAAHAFGVKERGCSVLNYGDLSILSFHATKVFNTIEGGAIVSHTKEMKQYIDNLKNFGFDGEITVIRPGINGKMNELQAAFGLLQLRSIDHLIAKRKGVGEKYRSLLNKVKGVDVFVNIEAELDYNYSYFPILINEMDYGMSRDALYELLKVKNIFARRYFYPLITDFSPYYSLVKHELGCAERIASKVICLPMYSELEEETIEYICDIIANPMS